MDFLFRFCRACRRSIAPPLQAPCLHAMYPILAGDTPLTRVPIYKVEELDSRILLSCVRVHPLARQARLHNSLLFLGHDCSPRVMQRRSAMLAAGPCIMKYFSSHLSRCPFTRIHV